MKFTASDVDVELTWDGTPGQQVCAVAAAPGVSVRDCGVLTYVTWKTGFGIGSAKPAVIDGSATAGTDLGFYLVRGWRHDGKLNVRFAYRSTRHHQVTLRLASVYLKRAGQVVERQPMIRTVVPLTG